MSGREAAGPGQALVDAHVHFHAGFDELRFFRSARRNFSLAAGALGMRGPWTGVLVLTDPAGSGAFRDFQGRGSRNGPLTFQTVEEGLSLFVGDREREGDGIRIVILAGAQIETAERLEVLAIPTRAPTADGLPLEETIARVVGQGSVAVLPWGFGKWTWGRGRHIARLLEGPGPRAFLLSDTGHRPALAPYPALLRRGETASVPVLAGSDPLPLPGEDRRAGAFCFTVTVDELDRTPGASVEDALRALTASPPRFGQAPGVLRFLSTQVAMQVRKRTGGGRR